MSPNTHVCLARYTMKKMVRAIKSPSAHARLRMRRVVTERRRMRARMLQTTKRLPGTPRKKTKLRMTAPMAVEKSLLTLLPSRVLFECKLEMLKLSMLAEGLILRTTWNCYRIKGSSVPYGHIKNVTNQTETNTCNCSIPQKCSQSHKGIFYKLSSWTLANNF